MRKKKLMSILNRQNMKGKKTQFFKTKKHISFPTFYFLGKSVKKSLRSREMVQVGQSKETFFFFWPY